MTQPLPPAASRTDDRAIAVLAHLSPVIALIVSAGWLSIVGPLVVWLIWRGRGDPVRTAAATSFNFSITVWIAFLIAWVCAFTVILLPVSLILWTVPGIVQIVLSVVGAVKAANGEAYRYPLQIPVLT